MILNMYERFAHGMGRLNMAVYVGMFVALKLALWYVSEHLYFSFANQSIANEPVNLGNIYVTFIGITILGPLLETYLTQYLFFKYLSGRISQWLIVVLSAIVFALFHTYNLGYVIYAFFSGLILSTSYALRLRSNPFLYNHWS